MTVKITQQDCIDYPYHSPFGCPLAHALKLRAVWDAFVLSSYVEVNGEKYEYDSRNWNYFIYQQLRTGKWPHVHLDIPNL